MEAASWQSPLSSGSAGSEEAGPGSLPQPPLSSPTSELAEFNQDTVTCLSPLRRVSTFDKEHVEGVQGGSGEEIRAEGVVGGADSSRLEQKASALH